MFFVKKKNAHMAPKDEIQKKKKKMISFADRMYTNKWI